MYFWHAVKHRNNIATIRDSANHARVPHLSSWYQTGYPQGLHRAGIFSCRPVLLFRRLLFTQSSAWMIAGVVPNTKPLLWFRLA
jgi:hypothetical protein